MLLYSHMNDSKIHLIGLSICLLYSYKCLTFIYVSTSKMEKFNTIIVSIIVLGIFLFVFILFSSKVLQFYTYMTITYIKSNKWELSKILHIPTYTNKKLDWINYKRHCYCSCHRFYFKF